MNEITITNNNGSLTVSSVQVAAAILREHGMKISDADLRAGLEQKVYPFGDAVIVTSQPVFHIYKPKLMKWIEERSEEQEVSA